MCFKYKYEYICFMKKNSQAFYAYEKIRSQILLNQISANLRLKEDESAKKFGVSRMAIREALNRLLGEGLVCDGEKGGYYVVELKQKDIPEIRQVRQVLELGALELMKGGVSKAQIVQLERLCDDFSSMVKNQYFSGACEVDMKFHLELVNLPNNPRLMHLYQLSHIPLFHYELRKMIMLNDYEVTDKEHRGIVNALKSNKIELAKTLLTKHFARGESAVLKN